MYRSCVIKEIKSVLKCHSFYYFEGRMLTLNFRLNFRQDIKTQTFKRHCLVKRNILFYKAHDGGVDFLSFNHSALLVDIRLGVKLMHLQIRIYTVQPYEFLCTTA